VLTTELRLKPSLLEITIDAGPTIEITGISASDTVQVVAPSLHWPKKLHRVTDIMYAKSAFSKLRGAGDGGLNVNFAFKKFCRAEEFGASLLIRN
jgi:hypothetical protein